MEQADNPSQPMPGYYYHLRKYSIVTCCYLSPVLIAWTLYIVVYGFISLSDETTYKMNLYLEFYTPVLILIIAGYLIFLNYRFKCSQCHKKTVTLHDTWCNECNAQICTPKINNCNAPYLIPEQTYIQRQTELQECTRNNRIARGACLATALLYFASLQYAIFEPSQALLVIVTFVLMVITLISEPPKLLTTCPHTDCNKTINPTKHNFCPSCGGQLTPTFTDQPETETT